MGGHVGAEGRVCPELGAGPGNPHGSLATLVTKPVLMSLCRERVWSISAQAERFPLVGSLSARQSCPRFLRPADAPRPWRGVPQALEGGGSAETRWPHTPFLASALRLLPLLFLWRPSPFPTRTQTLSPLPPAAQGVACLVPGNLSHTYTLTHTPCTHMYTRAHTCTHTHHTHRCTHTTHMCTHHTHCAHTCVHTHTCEHTCPCMYTMHTHLHSHTSMYTHALIHIHAFICTLIHTHTHSHRAASFWKMPWPRQQHVN